MTGEPNQKRGYLIEKRAERGIFFYRTRALKHYRRTLCRRLMNYALFTILAFCAGMRIKSNSDEKNVIFVDISPPFAALGGYLLSRFKKNSKLVLEITDLPESVFKVGLFNRPFLRNITDQVFRHIYRNADHIVTLTPGAKRHIRDLGIDEEKIITVMNWANPETLQPVPLDEIKKIRSKHGWEDKFVILYAGGHGRAYDLMTLIRAAEKLRNRDDLRIIFMGEGERKKYYIEYCKKRKLDICEFLSPVARNDLRAYLASADVCVNLFYRDEFWGKVVGHKIFDYFEAGRPIIFAGHGDTAHIILKARGGKVVPPEDPDALTRAIVELMENREETNRMGERGRDYLMREFEREKMLKILDSALVPS